MQNPFHLTRAADLNDSQINQLWVDPNGELHLRLRPASQLPMIILGGKGSGKTHLMRYFSYSSQRLQHGPEKMRDRVTSDRYLGIYARCSGLNASRFSHKRYDAHQWHTLFSYYLDLWLGQLILQTLSEYLADSPCLTPKQESVLIEDFLSLFDEIPVVESKSIDGFGELLRQLQRELDFAVNNASFRKALQPTIRASPTKLIFGIPRCIQKHIPDLSDIQFTIFIDEYEHLYEEAQRYVNTLVRERENPVTFKIGARLYGLKTFRTFSGDEELRQGSEYEKLNLDEELRNKGKAYDAFAIALCIARIRFSNGGKLPQGWSEETAITDFANIFEPCPPAEQRAAEKLRSKGETSPWLANLARQLRQRLPDLRSLNIKSEKDISTLISTLSFLENPLIEKANTFLLFRAWSKQRDLLEAARLISESAKIYYSDRGLKCEHSKALDKFKDDLTSQMLLELGLQQDFTGIQTWITMSNGIVRNLIITLKHIFDWASFHQEATYSFQGISQRSQNKGVEDSSNWFINDARVLGAEHGAVRKAINRIASLMRALRFSPKPPECSLSTFSVETDTLDSKCSTILELCQHWSLLINSADRKDRNTRAAYNKFKINGMIAPKYDLPLFTRGTIHLSSTEAFIIFCEGSEAEFARVERARLSRARPPFTPRLIEKEDNELRLF